MKNLIIILASIAMFQQLIAQDSLRTSPFQLSLAHPAQIVKKEVAISGVRLNIFYGINQEVNGIDFGIANKTLGNQSGMQYGLVNP